MVIIPFFLVFTGGWVFVSKHKHLLVMLVSLEMIMLGLFCMLNLWSGSELGEDFLILVFLALAACEGSVGLGVLVSLVRSHGSDMFSLFSILQY